MVIEIPGRDPLVLDTLVCDLNGTLAVDGHLPERVATQLQTLRTSLHVAILTAATFGDLDEIASRTGIRPVLIQTGDDKERWVRAHSRVAAVGNGANDAAMLGAADLAVAVLGREGSALPTLLAADVVVSSGEDALDLFVHPKRLVATLRP